VAVGAWCVAARVVALTAALAVCEVTVRHGRALEADAALIFFILTVLGQITAVVGTLRVIVTERVVGLVLTATFSVTGVDGAADAVVALVIVGRIEAAIFFVAGVDGAADAVVA